MAFTNAINTGLYGSPYTMQPASPGQQLQTASPYSGFSTQLLNLVNATPVNTLMPVGAQDPQLTGQAWEFLDEDGNWKPTAPNDPISTANLYGRAIGQQGWSYGGKSLEGQQYRQTGGPGMDYNLFDALAAMQQQNAYQGPMQRNAFGELVPQGFQGSARDMERFHGPNWMNNGSWSVTPRYLAGADGTTGGSNGGGSGSNG